MVISERQRESFEQRGLVRLDKLIPGAAIEPLRDLALQIFQEEEVWRDGAWLGDEADHALGNRVFRRLKDRAKQSAAFDELLTAEVLEAARSLAGGRILRPEPNRPQLLFTPPNAPVWTVPHKVWHLDVPRLGEVGLPGVQMFTFLADVPHGAGGTLVVAGSHRLLNDRGRVASKDVKRMLREEPYFRELLAPGDVDRRRFIDECGHVGGIELQVVELRGEPGDVFFTDLRLLHTLAPNASRVPRLMATQRFFRELVLDAREA